MHKTEQLLMELMTTERSCAGEQGWSRHQGKNQAKAREEICRTCPALTLCEEYAATLQRWQKLGTIAGRTYTRVHLCAGCGTEFEPPHKGSATCSKQCAGKVSRYGK